MDGTAEMAQGTAAGRPLTGSARVVVALDRVIYRVARHWLALAIALFGGHLLSLLLAPILVAAGQPGLARPIYAVNGLFCHQRPDRSFHLFGEKVAVCERCFAIYAALALAALGFAIARGRVERARPIDVALLAMPMVVDGFGQAAGLWESTAVTRVLTGALFGAGIAWLLLPYLEGGFAGIRLRLETLFARLAATGRARPL